MSATASRYLQVGNCAGVCVMPFMFFGNYPLIELLNAVTGWGWTWPRPSSPGAHSDPTPELQRPRGHPARRRPAADRMTGHPPQNAGPLAGVTIDVESLAREYRQAMGWNLETGIPEEATLKRLGLAELIRKFG